MEVFLLENNVTSEGAVSDNFVDYQQLTIAGYQVSFVASNYFEWLPIVPSALHLHLFFLFPTVSAVLAIPVAVFFDIDVVQFQNQTYDICDEMWPLKIVNQGYGVYCFVMLYLIPLTIIVVCYSIVLNRLWKAVSPTEETHAPVHLRMLIQKRRITRMILAVIVAFAACWIGTHIMSLWRRLDVNFPRTSTSALVFQTIAHLLMYFNSCVNPFVYAFMGGNFRKQMARAFPFLAGKKSAMTEGPTGSLIKSKSTQV